MNLIRIKFKDGTERTWRHEGRAGGSWTKTLKLEDCWAIVVNEYGSKEIFPRDEIASIETAE